MTLNCLYPCSIQILFFEIVFSLQTDLVTEADLEVLTKKIRVGFLLCILIVYSSCLSYCAKFLLFPLFTSAKLLHTHVSQGPFSVESIE